MLVNNNKRSLKRRGDKMRSAKNSCNRLKKREERRNKKDRRNGWSSSKRKWKRKSKNL